MQKTRRHFSREDKNAAASARRATTADKRGAETNIGAAPVSVDEFDALMEQLRAQFFGVTPEEAEAKALESISASRVERRARYSDLA
jgi:hypothetical protein